MLLYPYKVIIWLFYYSIEWYLLFKVCLLTSLILGNLSDISEELQRQNDIFNFEKNKQKEAVGRIEKIDVQYEGVPENCYFVMNKNISTPYDCAKRK